jgi:hypothetical protein
LYIPEILPPHKKAHYFLSKVLLLHIREKINNF